MAENSRASESRAATARPTIGGDDGESMLNIDTSGLPAGMEATWIRESTAGQYDQQNIRTAQMRRGYIPVTTEMMPHLNPPPLPGQPADTTGLIREGGLILMMRPKARGVADKASQHERNEEAKASASRIPKMSTDAGTSSIDGDNFVQHRQVTERVNSGAAPAKFKE